MPYRFEFVPEGFTETVVHIVVTEIVVTLSIQNRGTSTLWKSNTVKTPGPRISLRPPSSSTATYVAIFQGPQLKSPSIPFSIKLALKLHAHSVQDDDKLVNFLAPDALLRIISTLRHGLLLVTLLIPIGSFLVFLSEGDTQCLGPRPPLFLY
eukprot:1155965-Pelagomonas_calceolata.AAC.1